MRTASSNEHARQRHADDDEAASRFALVPLKEPELHLRHRWLDFVRGIGDVVRGMARKGATPHGASVLPMLLDQGPMARARAVT